MTVIKVAPIRQKTTQINEPKEANKNKRKWGDNDVLQKERQEQLLIVIAVVLTAYGMRWWAVGSHKSILAFFLLSVYSIDKYRLDFWDENLSND